MRISSLPLSRAPDLHPDSASCSLVLTIAVEYAASIGRGSFWVSIGTPILTDTFPVTKVLVDLQAVGCADQEVVDLQPCAKLHIDRNPRPQRFVCRRGPAIQDEVGARA